MSCFRTREAQRHPIQSKLMMAYHAQSIKFLSIQYETKQSIQKTSFTAKLIQLGALDVRSDRTEPTSTEVRHQTSTLHLITDI